MQLDFDRLKMFSLNLMNFEVFIVARKKEKTILNFIKNTDFLHENLHRIRDFLNL